MTFIEDRERYLKLLLSAGIEEDRAWEVASQAAIDASVRRAENFEDSPNVYGDKQ